ncbi:hypothetical protein SASPL_111660 [Salvia splendens]|uniref:Uncharacterized protein n=1 Tax=Salvia splendens TaxID=180675 RepID=A0A8X8YCC0_SALSN|nr:hypothetical protein SASPL_111660 [Salvia splendens]
MLAYFCFLEQLLVMILSSRINDLDYHGEEEICLDICYYSVYNGGSFRAYLLLIGNFMCKRFYLFCLRHLLVLEVLCVALPSLSRYSNGEERGEIDRLPNRMLLKLQRVVMHRKTEWMEMANTADKFIQSIPKYGNEAIIFMSRLTYPVALKSL